jgi:hypothetical protein
MYDAVYFVSVCMYLNTGLLYEDSGMDSTLSKFTHLYTNTYNGELHNLYSSPNIIIMMKSRRVRWAGYVARMGELKNAGRILMGKPGGKSH